MSTNEPKPIDRSDLTGEKNVYICPSKHRTITIDRDKGVTPMFLTCKHEGCSLDARSCFYPPGVIGEPEYEWYKPTLDELKEEVKTFARKQKLSYRNIWPSFWEHWHNGGLSLRKIEQPGFKVHEGGRGHSKAALLAERYGTDVKPEIHGSSCNSTTPIKVGRNDGCPCGSGKKYKNCCLKLMK